MGIHNFEAMEKTFCDVEKQITELDLEEWQANIIHDAVYYDLMLLSQIEGAAKILKLYSNTDAMFSACSDAECDLKKTLAMASQL